MTISTMKLRRVTLDALKNLEQDPDAVERAVDGWQGRIKADRSAGNNARQQAESVQNLVNTITSVVPKAMKGLSDIGDKEAFDEWQNSSPEQKEMWRTSVKNQEVAGFHSPMFLNGLEKMVAAEHVQKYQRSFQENYVDARTKNDKKFQNDVGEFDFLKWQEQHFYEYTQTNGITNMNSNAFGIFSKGIAPIHKNAVAKRAEARGAKAEQDHLNAFSANVKLFLDDPTITPEVFGTKMDAFFGEVVTSIPLDSAKYHAAMRDVVENKYIESVVAGNDDAEQYLEALGNTKTGSNSQKFKDTVGFDTWVRTTQQKGDAAWNRMKDKEVKIEALRTKEKGQEITQAYADHQRNGGTKQEFFNANPEYAELAKTWYHSIDPVKKSISDQLYGMRKGGMTEQAFNEFKFNMDPNKAPEQILADLQFRDGDMDQVAEVKKMIQDRSELATGIYGDEAPEIAKKKYLVNTATEISRHEDSPENWADIDKDVRASWYDKHNETYNAQIWKIAGMKDLDLPEKRKLAQQALATLNESMEEEKSNYATGKATVLKASQEKDRKEKVQNEYIKSNPKDASLFLRGDKYTDRVGVLLKQAQGAKEGSEAQQGMLREMNQSLLLSKRYTEVSDLYDIPLTVENLPTLRPLVNSMLERIRKDLPPLAPEDKKKVQENVVESLADFVSDLPRPVQLWMNPVGNLLGASGIVKDAESADTPESADSGQLSDAERLVIDREGTKTNDANEPISYMDSEDKLTGGHGHLMTKAEQDKYPEGTVIPGDVVAKWWKADSKKAKTAAKKQAKELGIPELEDILMSVNFQLGSSWHTKKFPSAYKALKAKDYERAIFEIEHNEAGDAPSLWMDQTANRVADFKDAIRKL
jgi:hypothetical protein